MSACFSNASSPGEGAGVLRPGHSAIWLGQFWFGDGRGAAFHGALGLAARTSLEDHAD